MRKRQGGQALVEFAFTLPMFMLLVFSTIELALVFVTYYSETHMARETSRWLAVHSATTSDSALADQVHNTMLPGLVNGSSTLVRTGDASNPSEYKVGGMTVDFTSCLPNGSGVCTNPSRVAGATLYVQMSYDISPLLFLPTRFTLGSLSVTLPTSLPVYKVSTMVE
jgi:Flp pilus assembly protein TadG